MNTQISTERPRFKTRTNDAGFDLSIALPGLAKEDVRISLEKRLLSISGERKTLEGEFQNHNQEALRFELNVNLHEDLDADNIKATHLDGILTLSLQKRKELAPRKIDILAN